MKAQRQHRRSVSVAAPDILDNREARIGVLTALMLVVFLALLGAPSLSTHAADVLEPVWIEGGRRDIIHHAILLERSSEMGTEPRVSETSEEITLLLRDQFRSLKPAQLVKEFGARLNLIQLAKVVVLQGENATRDILTQVGVRTSGAETFCKRRGIDSQFLAAQTLLAYDLSNNGSFTRIESRILDLMENYPLELREEILSAAFRALAATCVVDYLSTHRPAAPSTSADLRAS